MTLVVENKDINTHFIKFLKRRIMGYISLIMNFKRLKPFDEYFNSNEFKSISNNVVISSKRIITMGMTNLVHKRYETNTHIFINPNITYPGTTIKIVDLCKLINYGTLSLEGYPIFTKTFDHFSKNIKKYRNKCILGLR